MAVAGYGRPLPLLAFIVAATFPDDVVLLRAGADDRLAFVQRGKEDYLLTRAGSPRRAAAAAALRLARRAKASAAEAALDAGSAKLERNIPIRRRRGRAKSAGEIPTCFGGRGMDRNMSDFVM